MVHLLWIMLILPIYIANYIHNAEDFRVGGYISPGVALTDSVNCEPDPTHREGV
jgi:hypothetical protein